MQQGDVEPVYEYDLGLEDLARQDLNPFIDTMDAEPGVIARDAMRLQRGLHLGGDGGRVAGEAVWAGSADVDGAWAHSGMRGPAPPRPHAAEALPAPASAPVPAPSTTAKRAGVPVPAAAVRPTGRAATKAAAPAKPRGGAAAARQPSPLGSKKPHAAAAGGGGAGAPSRQIGRAHV